MISVLWPLGRGNVAYGANVGSNHTRDVCLIKKQLQDREYSIVAAGTTLVPQRVTMPFSLFVGG